MSIQDELQSFWNAYAAAYSAGDAGACGAMFTAEAELHPMHRRLLAATLSRLSSTTWTQGHGKETEKKMTVIHAGRAGDFAWCLAT